VSDFVYKAAKTDGSQVKGRISAASKAAAMTQLRRQGMLPVSLELDTDAPPVSKAGQSANGWRVRFRKGDRINLGKKQQLNFTRELATMLRAGLALDKALQVLLRMSREPAMQKVVQDLLDGVKSGKGFSQALAVHRQSFGDFYINIVRAGEASGQLAAILARLAEHMERARQLRDSVVSALIYPLILLTVAVLSVFIMLAFVVPQFEALFEDMGEGLPMATRLVVAAGDFVAHYWWGFMLALLVVLVVIDQVPRSESGRQWRDRSLLSLPWLGAVLKNAEAARFSRTMGTLLGSGVSMLESITIAVDTIGNVHIRRSLSRMQSGIKQGGTMTAQMEKSGLFSPLAIQMVQVGEESGKLDQMLLDLAAIIDNEVRTGVKRVITILEPLLILVLGALIAGIILAILMGIMSVNEMVG